jgi:hypothetical protein
MRRYSRDEEERIRAQTLVREWTRSKLLDPSQGAQLAADLRVDVRRTNVYLRAGLALFAALIAGASVLFVMVGLNLNRGISIAVASGVAAMVCIALAETLVTRFRFYRFGVEEALAVASVVLLGASGASLTETLHLDRFRNAPEAVGLFIAAAGGFALYRRFGFVYAAVGGMVCAAAIPFQLHLLSPTIHHVLAAATLASAFAVARSKRLKYQDDYPGDDYGLLQAAAWAGLYLVLNLQLIGNRIEGLFYWFTYMMTWVLPVVGLYLGIREKDRPLIDVSLVMALVTLLTNKSYLRATRHEWDPILLGIFLIVVALSVRQWLLRGAGGQRRGFTPKRLLNKDNEALTLLRTASVTFQPNDPAARPDPVKSDFDGGRSGGGGASGTF